MPLDELRAQAEAYRLAQFQSEMQARLGRKMDTQRVAELLPGGSPDLGVMDYSEPWGGAAPDWTFHHGGTPESGFGSSQIPHKAKAKVGKGARETFGKTKGAFHAKNPRAARWTDGEDLFDAGRNLTRAERAGALAVKGKGLGGMVPKMGLMGMLGAGATVMFLPSIVKDAMDASDQVFGTDIMGHRKSAERYGEMARKQAEQDVLGQYQDLWEQERTSQYLDNVEMSPTDMMQMGMQDQMERVDQFKLSVDEQRMMSQLAVREDGPSYMEVVARLGLG